MKNNSSIAFPIYVAVCFIIVITTLVFGDNDLTNPSGYQTIQDMKIVGTSSQQVRYDFDYFITFEKGGEQIKLKTPEKYYQSALPGATVDVTFNTDTFMIVTIDFTKFGTNRKDDKK